MSGSAEGYEAIGETVVFLNGFALPARALISERTRLR